MAFRLTDGQQQAVLMAISWYYMGSHIKPLLAFSGLAGSGKSTVVKYIVEALGINTNHVLYTALTGKAVSVLRLKGHLSNTIHKSFYNARKVGNNVYFSLKQSISPSIRLIVIDEFGMVSDNMINDIISFGVPVIGLGDHGQLPPIMGKNTYLTEENLDIFLKEVMRTDDTTGILDIAMAYRNKEIIRPGIYGDSRILSNKNDIKPFIEYDAVLCWTNKTRKELNVLIRAEVGFDTTYPMKGEKIYFMNNRYDKVLNYNGIEIVIVNGLECTLLEDSIIVDKHRIHVKAKPNFIDDDKFFFEVEISRLIFDSYYDIVGDTNEMMDDLRNNSDTEDIVYADFAYALGTHKSQGSEYNNVLVMDEMPKFRPEYSRFMYTGVTRAKYSVDVLLDQ